MGFLATRLHLGVRGSVRVALEQDALLPGDALVGTVFLDVAKPVGSATLTVCVHGCQTLNWTTSSGDAMIAHSKKFDHLLKEIELVGPSAAFAVGETQYPFEFALPVDLQHNFVYRCKRIEELQSVCVCVHYIVEATLSVKDGAASDLSGKALFRVNALPMAVPFGRRVGAAREDTVKFLAMFKRGSCHIGLSINTDVLDAASTIEARVRLQLNTPQSPKYIVLVLYEDVLVNRHNPRFPGSKRGARPICARRYERAMIEASETADNVITMQLQLPIASHTFDKALVLNPTMRSFFVSVSYRVAVEVKFPLAPRIRVHAPVTVIPRLVAPHELEVTAIEEAVLVTT